MIIDACHEIPEPAAAGVVLLCDPNMYTDLVTADYASGTSVTNAIQSEAPEPPTALTATPQPQEIEFTWTLGAFWTLHGITELWEHTANTPFSSATRIWQGRGTRVVITKSDTTERYYWVRMRTVAGQVSDEFGVSLNGNGLAAAARKSETPDIDDNAATEVESVEDDTASLINGGGVVLSDSLTAVGLSYLLQVTATFDVWITSVGGTPEFSINVNGNGSSIGVSQSAFPVITTSPGQRITLQCEVPVDPSDEAGSGVVVQLVWTGSQPAGTAEVRNAAMRSEKIKR